MPASHVHLQGQFSKNWFLGLANWITRFDHYLELRAYDDCGALLDILLAFPLSPRETRIAEQREGFLAWERGGLDASARERYWAYVEYFEALETIADQIRSLVSLAFILRKQGNTNEAEEYIMRAIDAGTEDESYPQILCSLLDSLKGSTKEWEFVARQHFSMLTKSEEYLAEVFAHGAWNERDKVVSALVELRMANPLIQALDSPDVNERIFGIRGMERLAPHLQASQMVPALEKAVQDKHWFVRWRGAAAMVFLQKATGTTSLIATLSDMDPDVRAQAAKALGLRKEKQAFSVLVKLLDDPDSYVRSVVAEALGYLGETTVAGRLLLAMDDPDLLVQRKAIRALSLLKDHRALGKLLDLVKRDVDLALRLEAIHALGEFGDAGAGKVLDDLALHLSGVDNVHGQLRKAMRQAARCINKNLTNNVSSNNVLEQIRLLGGSTSTNSIDSDQNDLEASIRLLP